MVETHGTAVKIKKTLLIYLEDQTVDVLKGKVTAQCAGTYKCTVGSK